MIYLVYLTITLRAAFTKVFYVQRSSLVTGMIWDLFLSSQRKIIENRIMSDSFQANISHHVVSFPISPSPHTLFGFFFVSILNISFQSSCGPNFINIFKEPYSLILNIRALPPSLSGFLPLSLFLARIPDDSPSCALQLSWWPSSLQWRPAWMVLKTLMS